MSSTADVSHAPMGPYVDSAVTGLEQYAPTAVRRVAVIKAMTHEAKSDADPFPAAHAVHVVLVPLLAWYSPAGQARHSLLPLR